MSDAAERPVEAPSTPAKAGSGLPENVAGALAYGLGPVTGLLFFFLDRDRSFVRFHAIQCLALCVVGIALSIGLTVLGGVLAFIPILGWLVGLLLSVGVGLAGFAIWVWLMVQAYQGKDWAVPGLAPHVRRITAETGAAIEPAA